MIYSCIHATFGTVTLYESSWWPVGTQLELYTVFQPNLSKNYGNDSYKLLCLRPLKYHKTH